MAAVPDDHKAELPGAPAPKALVSAAIAEIEALIAVAKVTVAFAKAKQLIADLEPMAADSTRSDSAEADALLKEFLSSGLYVELKIQNDKVERCLSSMFEDEKNWTFLLEKGPTKIFQRKEAGEKTLTFLLKSTVKAPIINIISAIYETDLLTNWMPMLKKATPMATVSIWDKIVQLVMNSPWPLACREMMLDGFGVDLEEKSAMLCIMSSLEEHKMVKIPPPDPSMVRIRMVIGGFFLQCVDEDTSSIHLLMNIDPNTPGMPDFIMSFFVKNFLGWIFANLEKCAKEAEDPKSEYKSRIASNPKVYSIVQTMVSEKLKDKKAKL